MLVTRPEPDASDTAGRLDALGIGALKAPMLTQQVLTTSLPDAEGFGAMAITSANALRALQARGVLEAYLDLPVYAVGQRTAGLAREMGFARVESAGGTVTKLVELLGTAPIDGPILYASGREVTSDLGRALAPTGRMVITAEVYAMVAASELPEAVASAIASGRVAAALFYSTRSAAVFAQLTAGLPRQLKARLGVICLSEAVALPLVDAHFVRVALADYPSEEAMMGLALSFARDENAP
ncbi:uroporphyrinogen-III synthase [Devosia sp.]|uniref:uroporphyrinogen-III synthase n=1 Tax=Devosia sp. TaxID=1871048 RepID=UPI003A8E25FA